MTNDEVTLVEDILADIIEEGFKRKYVKLSQELTLKATVTTAADDIQNYFFIVFQRK